MEQLIGLHQMNKMLLYSYLHCKSIHAYLFHSKIIYKSYLSYFKCRATSTTHCTYTFKEVNLFIFWGHLGCFPSELHWSHMQIRVFSIEICYPVLEPFLWYLFKGLMKNCWPNSVSPSKEIYFNLTYVLWFLCL